VSSSRKTPKLSIRWATRSRRTHRLYERKCHRWYLETEVSHRIYDCAGATAGDKTSRSWVFDDGLVGLSTSAMNPSRENRTGSQFVTQILLPSITTCHFIGVIASTSQPPTFEFIDRGKIVVPIDSVFSSEQGHAFEGLDTGTA